MNVSSTGVRNVTANPILEFLGIFRRTALLRESHEQSDGQLLERFVGGDGVALETLVRRHAPMVWGVCRRTLARPDDAEDAFQATFLVLLRKAGSIWPREQLANWLYGVAYKTACKARQNAAKRYAREKQVETMPEPPAEPPDDVFVPELLAHLDRELNGLPEKYRTAVVLCELQGRTLRDVAQQLRVAEGTVASRLARGRAMLAQRMSRPGPAVSAGSVAAVCSQQAASGAVPQALLTRTVEAVRLVAAGQTVTAGLLSPQVLPLKEGVLHAMAGAKRKAAGVVLLLAGLAMGGGIVTYQILASQPSNPLQPPELASQPGVIEQSPRAPKGSGADPDPEKDGTRAGARILARRYLFEHKNRTGQTRYESREWPSKSFKATFDPGTHQWTVIGALRRDFASGFPLILKEGRLYFVKPVQFLTADDRAYNSWERDWKLVLSYNPSTRSYGVQKAEGFNAQERDVGWCPAGVNDLGKWLQGRFRKPNPSAAPVTALRLVVNGRERNCLLAKNNLAVELNPPWLRGVRVSIDDPVAGEKVKRWTLEFGAPYKHSLKVGEYGGAASYNHGVDSGSQIRVDCWLPDEDQKEEPDHVFGCLDAGDFVVRELELQGQKVSRLAIDFITDTAYGLPSGEKRNVRRILRGSLRFNSQFEPSIPELAGDTPE
jgi:RNA polymerase sigma factor (sigma-70 family)